MKHADLIPMMRRSALFAALCVAPTVLLGQELIKGKIIDKVICAKDPAQSYALYLPPDYDPAKKWPILYAFDPGGRGREPLARFKEAAEAREFLVACSFNSRNGPWEPIFAAAAAMWADTHARLAIDDERVFAAGFSGGARAASIFSKMIGRPIAGVIACGAGVPEGFEIDKLDPSAFCGIVGTADFNFREVMDLDGLLDRRTDIPHWIRTFDGPHSWPPIPVCSEAVEWLELAAAKHAGQPPDRALADALIAKTAARATALEATGDVFRAVSELDPALSAFTGMGDTSGIVGTSDRLRRTDAYRRSAKREAEHKRKEEALLTELYKTLTAIEKTVVLRRDLVPFFSEIDGLVKSAKEARDASDRNFARRALLTVDVDAADRGGAFLGSKVPAKAILCYEIAVRASAHDPARYGVNLYNLACAHARSGNVRMALDSLRQAVENGFSDKALILRDNDLDAIRDRPEFREILANIR
jgi:hypothetical protein